MNNCKIITIKKNTELYEQDKCYHSIKAGKYEVISETESHFFITIENRVFSVRKEYIKKITFKNRNINFNDLKKNEILNIFSNYNKLIKKAQKISKEISKFKIDEYDMSLNNINDLRIYLKDNYLILEHLYLNEIRRCRVPIKYLWDHDYKKTLIKEYSKYS